jgi:type II secretory pathway component PulF
MAVFTYEAMDAAGRTTRGTVDADSRAAALDVVMSRGLSPLIMEAADARAPGLARLFNGAEPSQPRIPARAVEAFIRELANLLGAGLSLSRALKLLCRETSNPAAKAAWTAVHDDVIGGESLAQAMSRFPRAFPQVTIAMIRAGETGGFLHLVLQQIAEFRQREKDLVGKVKAAMIYPIALACVAAGVLVFLMTFFIPRFSVIFDQFGSRLPWLTRIVVTISQWLMSYGPLLALLAVVAAFLARRWFATHAGRRQWERAVLALPGLGLLVARFALVRFSRMLGTLIAAGVPLVTALRVAREAIANQTLADTVAAAIDEVQRGQPLSRALAADNRLFPTAVIETISVAEETGRLDHELIRVSTTYEGDLDRHLRMTVALAEPLLLVLMAGLIGTVVVSMMLPVFTLQDMIN